MNIISEKCGCGNPVRYETPSGLACNKYMRCAEKPIPVPEVLNNPNHPAYKEITELLAKLNRGEIDLS